MALIEKMQLMQHEKTFTTDEAGNPQTIEFVKYAHVIERDGVQIQAVPHRIVIDRTSPDTQHPMPDGTAKTTADIMGEIDV